MYLHLGQDTVVLKRSIVGVFDLDNTSHSKITRSFLAAAQGAGHIEDISGELPRSFAVTEDGGETRVYLSQITPATLLRRFDSNGFE